VELASRVPQNLSSLRGIDDQFYGPIASHWQAVAPTFRGSPVQLSDVATFVKDVLSSDPFGTGHLVPFVDFRPPSEGKVMAITQRQLAFLVANVLMGNTIPAGDGLTAAIRRCSKLTAGGNTGLLRSLLSLLAVLSRELPSGQHGTVLIGATPQAGNSSWKKLLDSSYMAEPNVCVNHGNGTDCGQEDFMSGNNAYQAVTDIAGGVVGGGAQLCDIANSQDESIVQFYSEVLAFAFFTSGNAGEAADKSMLPVPFVLLGARRYVRGLSGEWDKGTCGKVLSRDWLNEEILQHRVGTEINGNPVMLAASSFVAVASECSTCLAGSACNMSETINNQCDNQRRHLEEDLEKWYVAFEPTMYMAPVQEAFRRVVKRIGTGPWGAGVWYGDSQQYFLATWLATTLLKNIKLDYHVYRRFCENPHNQCFVLGRHGCAACIADEDEIDKVRSPASAEYCGRQSLYDMVSRFKGQPASQLYRALREIAGPPIQVFDLLASTF